MAAAKLSQPLPITDPAAVAGWLMSVIYKASSRKISREEQVFARAAMDYLFDNSWNLASIERAGRAHCLFQQLQQDGHSDASTRAIEELTSAKEALK